MKKRDPSLQNKHHLIIGTSGSGKSSWLRQRAEIKNARRVLAWDPDEDHKLTHYHSVAQFIQAVKRAGGGPIRAGLTVDPTPDNFERYCAVLFAVASSTRPTVAIVEEISAVTSPGRAPRSWGIVVRQGRKYGIQLYAVTQRPAECDKTVLNNTPYKWVGAVEPEDRQRVARILGVDVEKIAGLKHTTSGIEYLYKAPGAEVQKKTLRFPRRANPKP